MTCRAHRYHRLTIPYNRLLWRWSFARRKRRARVAAAPGVQSSYYLHQLLQRTTASREDLYARIQALAIAAGAGPADLGAQLESEFKVQLPRLGYAEMLAHYQTQYQAVKLRVQPPAVEQQA